MTNGSEWQSLLQTALAVGETPEHVEQTLWAIAKQRGRRRAVLRGISAAAVAAGLLWAIAVTRPSGGSSSVTTTQSAAPQPDSASQVVTSAHVPASVPSIPTKPTRAIRPATRAPRRLPPPEPAEAPFVPVGAWQAIEPMERGSVLRVQLPRASLATFGIPVRPDRWNETVRADVVLGEDGTVRAVRFVSPMQ
jgi:hypothetical protein